MPSTEIMKLCTPVKVLFVIDRIGIQEMNSIPVLSAVAKLAGHQVKIVEYGVNEDKSVREIESYHPDIIAYSLCSNEVERYIAINNALKNRIDFFALFGGPHPTFFPDFIHEENVDAICKGEGDLVFPRLLNTFGTDALYKVDNFSFKLADHAIINNTITNLVSDLDSLPFPDRELVFAKNAFQASSPVKTFFSNRGCPFKCSYCFNHAYNDLYSGKGRVIRTKSVSYLIEEIRSVAEQYPLSFVKFYDDVFGLDRDWLKEFSEVYPIKIGLPFNCLASPVMVTDEYVKLLKKAGCFSIATAIESGNEKIRNIVLSRHISNQQVIDACSLIRGQGIRIYSLNMVGLPGETEKEIMETIELNQQAGIDYADATIFQPYPGTDIMKYCIKIGLLDAGFKEFNNPFSSSVLNFTADFKTRIAVLRSLFAIIVKNPWLKFLYPVFVKMRFLQPLLDLGYRFYYGIKLHKTIYAGKIPFRVQLKGAFSLLFSKNRF